MSVDLPAATTPILPEPTEARFSMRALFIVTTALAIIAAVVSPLVRRLPPDAQVRLLAAWGIWLLMALLWIGYQARQRFQAERLAGRTLARLKLLDEQSSKYRRRSGTRSITWAAVLLLISLFYLSNFAISAVGRSMWYELALPYVSFTLFSSWLLARLVTLIWWRNKVQLCEAGVLWDRRVMPWGYILATEWDAKDENMLIIQGIDRRNTDAVLRIAVQKGARDLVQNLLDGKLSQSRSVPAGPAFRELGSLPISVAVRDPNFFKYLGMVALFVGLFIGAQVFITSGGAPAEFRHAIFITLILWGILGSLRWRFVGRQAGEPLVRIVIRADRRQAALCAVVAAGFWYWASSKAWTSTWLAYAAGLGFGCALIGFINCLFQGRVVRAGGVVQPGIFYWPWPEVRFVQWQCEPKGRLILSRGWRRIVANVPPEQREAVEAVLNEKLSYGSVRSSGETAG